MINTQDFGSFHNKLTRSPVDKAGGDVKKKLDELIKGPLNTDGSIIERIEGVDWLTNQQKSRILINAEKGIITINGVGTFNLEDEVEREGYRSTHGYMTLTQQEAIDLYGDKLPSEQEVRGLLEFISGDSTMNFDDKEGNPKKVAFLREMMGMDKQFYWTSTPGIALFFNGGAAYVERWNKTDKNNPRFNSVNDPFYIRLLGEE